MLIGSEIGAQRDWIGETEIAIVGDVELADLYARGISTVGAQTRIVDGVEATLAGLKAVRLQD